MSPQERARWLLNHFKLLMSTAMPDDRPYVPTQSELDELAEIDRIQTECTSSHRFEDLDPEDGCLDCGYYSK